MYYHPNWDDAHARGNIGASIRVGLLDQPGKHRDLMSTVRHQVAPGVELVYGDPRIGASELLRLCSLGCGIVAMPFVFPGVVAGPVAGWDEAINEAANYGVLLVAGTGNDNNPDPVPSTEYPGCHPLVYTAAAITDDGYFDPTGSSRSGKCDLGIPTEFKSSGATVAAACCFALWLGHAIFPFGAARLRRPATDLWLSGGNPLPSGRGVVPPCGSL